DLHRLASGDVLVGEGAVGVADAQRVTAHLAGKARGHAAERRGGRAVVDLVGGCDAADGTDGGRRDVGTGGCCAACERVVGGVGATTLYGADLHRLASARVLVGEGAAGVADAQRVAAHLAGNGRV